MTAQRYALYWAPPHDSALAAFGARWLGRDAETGGTVAPIPSEEDRALMADPRRYGLHATLKPPFALASGASVEALEAALAAFAALRAPVELGYLQVTDLKGFLALCTPARVPALHDLADDCVRAFDSFRAPSGEAELAKRRKAGLTPAQDAHLIAWGYPYVMEQFQFHVTLTQRLEPSTRARIKRALEKHLRMILARPFVVTDLALFEEPAPGADFILRRRFALGG
jgi:putative phosphonate metabolism protein